MTKRPIFVTGIGTGVGKTLVSAVLTEKWKTDYWKPVQTGDLDYTDTQTVKQLISNPFTKYHKEAYSLSQPYSPHKAAALDGVIINPKKIVVPETQNQLVIEGAGGLLAPLTDDFLMIDFIKKFDAEVILVVRNYLGSINHSLLSVEMLKSRKIPIKALIFNGEPDEYSERLIINYSKVATSFHLPEAPQQPDKAWVADAGKYITIGL